MISEAQRHANAVKAGKARAKQFTRASQQHARAHVRRESLRESGGRGAKATIERHGLETFRKHWQAWKAQHPSPGEQAVRAALDAAGTQYEADAQLPGVLPDLWTVDFLVLSPTGVIMVQGEVHDPERADVFDPDGRKAERERQRMAMLEAAGFPALVIDWRQIGQAGEIVAEWLSRLQPVEWPAKRAVEIEELPF